MLLWKSQVTGYKYDPLKCARRLVTLSNGEFNTWVAGYKDNPEFEENVIKVGRTVFDLDDYNQYTRKGYCDQQVLDLLAEFLDYLSKKG